MHQAQERRIVGKFIKQVWAGRKGDWAIPISTVQFDATRAVLVRDLDFIHRLRDDDDTSDEIGRECVGWDGPCEVYLTESVVQFFGLGDDDVPDFLIERVTEEMLGQARTYAGTMMPSTATLQLNLKVSYNLNGESADMLKANLLHHVERGIGEGMLTGITAAEVDEHSFDVQILPDASLIIEETRHAA